MCVCNTEEGGVCVGVGVIVVVGMMYIACVVYCLVGCGYVVGLAVSDGVDARRGRVGMFCR